MNAMNGKSAEEAAEAIADGAKELRDQARAAVSAAKSAGTEAIGTARETATRVAGTVRESYDRSPILVVGAAVAILAVAGLVAWAIRRD